MRFPIDHSLPCLVSVVFLTRNGWTLPLKNLDDAAGSLEVAVIDLEHALAPQKKGVAYHSAPNQTCVVGGVVPQGRELSVINLSLGDGERYVLGSGDKLARKLGLTILGQQGQAIQKSTNDGLRPSLQFRSFGNGYGLRLTNQSSQDPTVVMMGILNVR